MTSIHSFVYTKQVLSVSLCELIQMSGTWCYSHVTIDFIALREITGVKISCWRIVWNHGVVNHQLERVHICIQTGSCHVIQFVRHLAFALLVWLVRLNVRAHQHVLEKSLYTSQYEFSESSQLHMHKGLLSICFAEVLRVHFWQLIQLIQVAVYMTSTDENIVIVLSSSWESFCNSACAQFRSGSKRVLLPCNTLVRHLAIAGLAVSSL